MAEPWIRRSAGELLTSAAWNDLQLKARAELAAVEQQVSTLLSGAEAFLTTGIKRDRRTVVADMIGGANGVKFERGGEWYGAEANLYYKDNALAWGFLPSPTLNFTLTRNSVVLLNAEGWVQERSYSSAFQFVLVQGGKRAPVRVNPYNVGMVQPLYTYDWPGEPSAKNWQAWLDYHDGLYRTHGVWPTPSWIGNFTSYEQGFTSTHNGPLRLQEAVELPSGDFKVLLGFTTNCNITTPNNYSTRISGLTVRATIL